MQVTRVFDIIEYQLTNYPLEKMVSHKRNGVWESLSTQEFKNKVDTFSSALLNMGLGKGSKIGLVSSGRMEWNIVDFGVQQIGAVLVPFYPNISPEEGEYGFNHSEIKVLFVSTKDIYQRIKLSVEKLGIKIYCFDEIDGLESLTNILAKTKTIHTDTINSIKASIHPNDLVTIIYTSGTTGLPKGVMLSHDNLLSNVLTIWKRLPLKPEMRILSFLPPNHIFERNVLNLYIFMGVSIHYAENLETVAANLQEVKPHMMTCVPRVLEKLYARIMENGSALQGAKHKLFFWAVRLTESFDITERSNSFGYNLQHAIADKLIYSKLRHVLGGEMKLMVSGAAPLLPKLIQFFSAAGIPVIEGYGLTETSPVITMNNYVDKTKRRLGTVGEVIEDVVVKIAEDGEILCKGPNVMLGYYKNDEATKSSIDSDGWYHTGDVGLFEDGTFLKITDRKKELLKTSGGKYIAPSYLESLLKSCTLIEQAIVIGEGKNYVSALIVPSSVKLEPLAQKLGLTEKNRDILVKDSKIIEAYKNEIEKINAHLNRYESIRNFVLIPKEWSIDGGELTPTLKLKRREIYKKYAKEIESLYTEK